MRVLIECVVQGVVVAAGLSALWQGYVAIGSRVTEGKGASGPSRARGKLGRVAGITARGPSGPQAAACFSPTERAPCNVDGPLNQPNSPRSATRHA